MAGSFYFSSRCSRPEALTFSGRPFQPPAMFLIPTRTVLLGPTAFAGRHVKTAINPSGDMLHIFHLHAYPRACIRLIIFREKRLPSGCLFFVPFYRADGGAFFVGGGGKSCIFCMIRAAHLQKRSRRAPCNTCVSGGRVSQTTTTQ